MVVGHVRIAATKSEVDVWNSLHTTIGCKDLNAESMPDLHCKLSKDVKAHRFVLDTDNWEHLKLEWPIEVAKKGAGSVVDITLHPEVRTYSFIFVLY